VRRRTSAERAAGRSETAIDVPRRTAEALAVAAVVLGCGTATIALRVGWGPRAQDGACAEILDRYVEARVRQLDPKPSASAVAASRAESSREALRSGGLAHCCKNLRAEAARCALEAGDADAIERCLQ